jgi:hypothetical protein
MTDYAWNPIEPVSGAERQIDLATMRPLCESWWASKNHLHEQSPAQLAEFNRRLVRRLSVETGILEHLLNIA